MDRLLRSAGALWLILFVPSVVFWGLVVNWSNAGSGRLVTTWNWLTDRLAYPVVVSPVTDPAARWLINGGVGAFFGFLILLICWSLMFAVPITLIGTWAEWLGRRVDPASRSREPSSAWNVLYLVTVPLALFYHALRAMFPAAAFTFLAVTILRFLYTTISTLSGDREELNELTLGFDRSWDGRFERFGFHHLFGGPWNEHFILTRRLLRQSADDPMLRYRLEHSPEKFSEIFILLGLEAMMQALFLAVLVGLIAVIYHGLKSLSE